MEELNNRGKSYKLKRMTIGDLRLRLRNFTSELKSDDQVKISTPQADCGIGPVQYGLTLPEHAKISAQNLQALNNVIEHEKLMGDALIKLDASLLFLATGKEDPKGFLPPGCRIAIRTEIQEATRETRLELGLAFGSEDPEDEEFFSNALLEKVGSQNRMPNPAEIALLCEIEPPVEEDETTASQNINYSYGGVKGRMAKHFKERRHIRRIRRIIRKEFEIGAVELIQMAIDNDSDHIIDMPEKKIAALEK